MESSHSYTIVKEHLYRRMTQDALWLGRNKDYASLLFEVDITKARRALQEERRKKKIPMSLTAFITWCVACTAKDFPRLFCKRTGHQRLALYDDVDILFPLSFTMDGEQILVSKILRAAQRRTFEDLNQQIESARAMVPPYISTEVRLFFTFPRFIRKMIYRWWSASPRRYKIQFGNILVSSFGMFTTGRLHAIGIPFHTLGVFIGSTFESQENLENKHIAITVVCDHGIFDAEYISGFIHQLKKCIEAGKLT